MLISRYYPRALWAALATSLICAAPALAQPLAITETPRYPNMFHAALPDQRAVG